LDLARELVPTGGIIAVLVNLEKKIGQAPKKEGPRKRQQRHSENRSCFSMPARQAT
jgi:hypothetical protein